MTLRSYIVYYHYLFTKLGLCIAGWWIIEIAFNNIGQCKKPLLFLHTILMQQTIGVKHEFLGLEAAKRYTVLMPQLQCVQPFYLPL